MKDCITIIVNKYSFFSALIKAIGKPREPALLILLDIYQRTRAATKEEMIQTVIPDEIRYKLFDIYGDI